MSSNPNIEIIQQQGRLSEASNDSDDDFRVPQLVGHLNDSSFEELEDVDSRENYSYFIRSGPKKKLSFDTVKFDGAEKPEKLKRVGTVSTKDTAKRQVSMRNVMRSIFFNPLSNRDDGKKTVSKNNELNKKASKNSLQTNHEGNSNSSLNASSPDTESNSIPNSPMSPSNLNGLEDLTPNDFADDVFSDDEIETTTLKHGPPRSRTVSDLHSMASDMPTDTESTFNPSHRNSLLSSISRSRTMSFSDDKALDGEYVFDDDSDIESTLDNGKFEVVAGSISSLIKFLAPLERIDNNFVSAFFLTYRYFLSPKELLVGLIERYSSFDNPEDAQSSLVQLRVLNILKKWVIKHTFDFRENPEIKEELDLFLKKIEDHPQYNKYAVSIRRFLEDSYKSSLNVRVLAITSGDDLLHSTKKRIQSVSFLSIDPKLIARQLTLREFEMFRAIELKELLHQAWIDPKNNEQLAPNLMKYISWFNKIASWVASEVCLGGNLKVRVRILRHIIAIARHCASMNNYNTVFEIVSGLALPPVSRLTKSWDSLPAKYSKYWETLNAKLNPKDNYKIYRTTMKEISLPALPYLGVYLTDLVYAETSTSTRLDSGKINFFKMGTLAKALSSILRFQERDYNLVVDSKVQQWLSYSMVVMDDELLSKSSYRAEPPE